MKRSLSIDDSYTAAEGPQRSAPPAASSHWLYSVFISQIFALTMRFLTSLVWLTLIFRIIFKGILMNLHVNWHQHYNAWSFLLFVPWYLHDGFFVFIFCSSSKWIMQSSTLGGSWNSSSHQRTGGNQCTTAGCACWSAQAHACTVCRPLLVRLNIHMSVCWCTLVSLGGFPHIHTSPIASLLFPLQLYMHACVDLSSCLSFPCVKMRNFKAGRNIPGQIWGLDDLGCIWSSLSWVLLYMHCKAWTEGKRIYINWCHSLAACTADKAQFSSVVFCPQVWHHTTVTSSDWLNYYKRQLPFHSTPNKYVTYKHSHWLFLSLKRTLLTLFI